jgi:hypothetical protein
MKKINLILLDIDGVIYDFVNYVLPYLDTTKQDKDITNYRMSEVLNITAEEFWKLLDTKVEGTFCNGKNYEWSSALINTCKKYCDNIAFCSNPGNNPKHWAEKRTWAEKHFPDIPLILTQNKEVLSQTGTVLIDDFNKNIDKFNMGDGIGIIFPQYWNTLNRFRQENGSVDYIDCTLEDIYQVGFENWKNEKR